jgi:hypothetical protein
MVAIPENVLARFNEVLKQRAIHETVHAYYRKEIPDRSQGFHLAMVFSAKGADANTRHKRVETISSA